MKSSNTFYSHICSYGIEDPEFAITQLAQTTMRSEIGKISLDMLFKVGLFICLSLLLKVGSFLLFIALLLKI